MGFGSYDESEQRDPDVDDEEAERAAVNVHENTHDGQMTTETGGSTDDLIGRLQEIKADRAEDD